MDNLYYCYKWICKTNAVLPKAYVFVWFISEKIYLKLKFKIRSLTIDIILTYRFFMIPSSVKMNVVVMLVIIYYVPSC